MYNKTQRFLPFSFHVTLDFYLMNSLVYRNIDKGIIRQKSKVLQNEKKRNHTGHFLIVHEI